LIERLNVGLHRELTLAEPEGFIRIFVDEDPPVARLLHETRNIMDKIGIHSRMQAVARARALEILPSI
jgi:hypothetical protein